MERPLKHWHPSLRFGFACRASPVGSLCGRGAQSSRSVPPAGEMRGGASAPVAVGNREVTPPGPGPARAAGDVRHGRELGPMVRGRCWCACSDSAASVAVAEGGLGLSFGVPLCAWALLVCYGLRSPREPIILFLEAAGWAAAGRAMGTSPRLPSPMPVAPPALGWATGSGAERSWVSIPTAFGWPPLPGSAYRRVLIVLWDGVEGWVRVGD